MKLEYGVIIAVGILVASAMFLIFVEPDEIPYWIYLQKIKQQEFEEGCDDTCKETQEEKRGYLCVVLESKQYICRPPREIFYPDEEIQIRTAFPPTYGEFAYIPEDHEAIKQSRFFDISNVKILNEEAKEILVEFKNHLEKDTQNYFEYSHVLYPGDTFVSHCMGGNSKIAHLMEYRDIIYIEEEKYIEFWGTHVDMPDELLPCKIPELIEQSLLVDMRLGISFGEEKEKLVEPGLTSNNFIDDKLEPEIPPNAGPLAGVHEHASILVPIFGDKLDFSKSIFQIKNPYIHFEGNDGATIHRHAENVTLGFLFETLNMQLTDECLTIPDGRYFCNEPADGFSLKFYINGKKNGIHI